MKHTKEYAEKLAKEFNVNHGGYNKDWSKGYINGYMKAIEVTNLAGLLDALKIIIDFPKEDLEHYKTYGVTMSLNKLQFNQIINAIKKATT